MEFCVFWVHTNNGAMQENHRRRNKIIKNLLVLVFSEIETIKRLLVDSVFIGQKSIVPERKCFKNQLIFNDFVFRRLIDDEDEKIRFLHFVRGIILKVDSPNEVRQISIH